MVHCGLQGEADGVGQCHPLPHPNSKRAVDLCPNCYACRTLSGMMKLTRSCGRGRMCASSPSSCRPGGRLAGAGPGADAQGAALLEGSGAGPVGAAAAAVVVVAALVAMAIELILLW